MTPPPAAVLRAFGVDADPAPLPGGEGTSFLAGDVVLKPATDIDLARWTQQLASRTSSTRILLPRPIVSVDGDWVAGGWTATSFVADLRSLVHEPERVISIGRELAAAFDEAGFGDTAPVSSRQDRWARADRCAWAADHVDLSTEAATIVQVLLGRLGDGSDRSTIIHGDLSGNVFADADDRPVVLDLTPYLGPVRYGSAIVVADHLLWHGATVELVDLLDGDEDGLARAMVFRLVAEQLATDPRHGADLHPYRLAIAELGW